MTSTILALATSGAILNAAMAQAQPGPSSINVVVNRPHPVQFTNGTPDYYLAAATIIPLLLIAYFFNVNIPETIQKLMEGKRNSRNLAYRVALELLAPLAAIVGAILGETRCLMALYSNAPTEADSDSSIAGLILLAFAGFIHLIIVSIIRAKRLLPRRRSNSEVIDAGSSPPPCPPLEPPAP